MTSPVAAKVGTLRLLREATKALRECKKVDPKLRYVMLFPDSDAARVGMGLNLLNSPAEDVYAKASDLLNRSVLKLCLKGPKEELMESVENRGIATFVTSQAIHAKLAHEQPKTIEFCKGFGGVGVGLVNSLVSSGAMTFEDGLDLVQKQGQAMDRAAKIVPSARVKVRVLPATQKGKVCRAAREHCVKMGLPPELSVCSVTKQNYAHVIEIAGHEEAIKYLESDGARLFRFRYIRRIQVAPHAFQTNLMQPVQTFMRGYIEHKLEVNPEYIKATDDNSFYSATTGDRVRGLKQIRWALQDYSVKSLKIEQLLHCMFRRSKTLAQPNVLVILDKKLMNNLKMVNRPAWSSAKLLPA